MRRRLSPRRSAGSSCGCRASSSGCAAAARQVGVPLLFSRLGFAENAASMLATTLAYLPKIPSLLLTMALIDRL